MSVSLEGKLSPEHKKIYKNIVLIATVFTVVLLLLLVLFTIKQRSGDSCGASNNQFYDNNPLVDGVVLNNSGDYLLQEIPLVDDHVRARFCYHVEANTSFTKRVQVVNEHIEILGLGWVNNQTTYYCHEINLEEGTTKQFIGIRCLDCNTSEPLIMKREYSSNQKKVYVYSNDGSYESDLSNVYAHNIRTLDDCRKTIKFLLRIYFTLIALLFLIVMMMVGFRSFRDFLFKDW